MKDRNMKIGKMDTMKQLLVINKEFLDYVNDDPELLSYLYDANLLPEQVTTAGKLTVFNLVLEAYRIGKES